MIAIARGSLSFYVYVGSSQQRCSVRKGVLRNFKTFIGKHLCRSLFFNKVAGLSPATLLKRLWHRRFSVNFVKFLRTPFHRTPLDDCFSYVKSRAYKFTKCW